MNFHKLIFHLMITVMTMDGFKSKPCVTGRTFPRHLPLILIENNRRLELSTLWEVINTLNFVIFDLDHLGHALDYGSFLSSPSYNFLAVSGERDILKELNHFS